MSRVIAATRRRGRGLDRIRSRRRVTGLFGLPLLAEAGENLCG